MGMSQTERIMAGEVARRLVDLRERHGLSREGAARLASRGGEWISHETVRRAEAGERFPTFRTLELLAHAYEVAVTEIVPNLGELVGAPSSRPLQLERVG